MFPVFEGLHNNIKFVIIGCTQPKLFKGNDQQGEREQTIVGIDKECMECSFFTRLETYLTIGFSRKTDLKAVIMQCVVIGPTERAQ